MIKYIPVRRLGYEASNQIQQSMARKILDLKKIGSSHYPHTIFGFEIDPPTYTYGRRQRGKIPVEELEHIKKVSPEAEMVETMRGGHTTFHGPGQLVLYPVLDLRELGIKVRDYVCILEKSIVSVLSKYQIQAEQRSGAGLNGVWITGCDSKIASVGVHVQRNVTTHGLALNVNVNPFYFQQIVPCNLPQAQMVSMSNYIKQTPSVQEVGETLATEIVHKMGHNLHKI